MIVVERHTQPEPDCHHDPALVEWSLPQEGLDIRLRIDTENMVNMSPAAREKMTLTLGRFAQVCDYIVARQDDLPQLGMSVESAFNFLAGYMQDLHNFYKMMSGELGPTESEDFSF
ncbi:MAG: hypothetical protein H6667_25545 [Ardenticatenaceae bacterium]|nr:hypothetical protein [Ardenticatenaceae bacterium]